MSVRLYFCSWLLHLHSASSFLFALKLLGSLWFSAFSPSVQHEWRTSEPGASCWISCFLPCRTILVLLVVIQSAFFILHHAVFLLSPFLPPCVSSVWVVLLGEFYLGRKVWLCNCSAFSEYVVLLATIQPLISESVINRKTPVVSPFLGVWAHREQCSKSSALWCSLRGMPRKTYSKRQHAVRKFP